MYMIGEDFLLLLNLLPNILCDTALLKVLSHLKYASKYSQVGINAASRDIPLFKAALLIHNPM